MTRIYAKGQGQRSLCSKVTVEINGRTEGDDCTTSPANAVGITTYRIIYSQKNCFLALLNIFLRRYVHPCMC